MGRVISKPDRSSDREYKNWWKCQLCLGIMKEALHDYIDNEVKKLHADITQKVCSNRSTNQCGSCSWTNIKLRVRNPNVWHINCGNSICDKWLQQILAVHDDPHNPTINWKNADISQWPTDCYQVAKIFMPKGQHKTTKMPEDLDAPAILSLMKYCNWFRNDLPNTQILSDLIDVRNTLAHRGNLKVTDSDKDKWIDLMIQLLNDLKIQGGAQNELQMVKCSSDHALLKRLKDAVFPIIINGGVTVTLLTLLNKADSHPQQTIRDICIKIKETMHKNGTKEQLYACTSSAVDADMSSTIYNISEEPKVPDRSSIKEGQENLAREQNKYYMAEQSEVQLNSSSIVNGTLHVNGTRSEQYGYPSSTVDANMVSSICKMTEQSEVPLNLSSIVNGTLHMNGTTVGQYSYTSSAVDADMFYSIFKMLPVPNCFATENVSVSERFRQDGILTRTGTREHSLASMCSTKYEYLDRGQCGLLHNQYNESHSSCGNAHVFKKMSCDDGIFISAGTREHSLATMCSAKRSMHMSYRPVQGGPMIRLHLCGKRGMALIAGETYSFTVDACRSYLVYYTSRPAFASEDYFSCLRNRKCEYLDRGQCGILHNQYNELHSACGDDHVSKMFCQDGIFISAGTKEHSLASICSTSSMHLSYRTVQGGQMIRLHLYAKRGMALIAGETYSFTVDACRSYPVYYIAKPEFSYEDRLSYVKRRELELVRMPLSIPEGRTMTSSNPKFWGTNNTDREAAFERDLQPVEMMKLSSGAIGFFSTLITSSMMLIASYSFNQILNYMYETPKTGRLKRILDT